MVVANVDFPPLKNNDIGTAAGIAAQKIIHQKSVSVELKEAATIITAVDVLLTSAVSTGTLRAFEATIVVQATDASRTVTVDLHKSTGGGAFATVLSTTVNITNSTTILVPVPAVINTAAVVDGDIFKIVVSVAGGGGTQAKGLVATLVFDEAPIG